MQVKTQVVRQYLADCRSNFSETIVPADFQNASRAIQAAESEKDVAGLEAMVKLCLEVESMARSRGQFILAEEFVQRTNEALLALKKIR